MLPILGVTKTVISKRSDGYFWVKEFEHSDWEIAQYDSENDAWSLMWEELPLSDNELFEINETRILPPQN